MSAAPSIDFGGLAQAMLSQAKDLLPRWFPAGKFVGREFVIGDLYGSPGESLSVNTQTGQWADFSTDDRGGDLISLFAAMHRLTQADAARQLAGPMGFEAAPRTARVTSLPTPESPEWDGLFPIPADAPPPPTHHPMHGAPAHIAHYRDRDGSLLALMYRCEPAGARKQVVPLTYCRRADGKREWRWQSLPKPRSLYRLELLNTAPSLPVLIVEGEPKCDAANKTIGQHHICISWPGGAKAWKHVDWSLLKGRTVAIWPDNDEPGQDAARQIAAQLRHHQAKVRVLAIPPGHAEGWDAGDAIKEGWSAERLLSHIEPPTHNLPLVHYNEIKPTLTTLDFVEDLLIERGAVVVYGESNSGKTFFASDLALHVAAGRTWRNRQVTQGGIVYVALEGSAGFFNRVEAWKREIAEDGTVVFAAIPASINMLDPDADTARLIDAVKDAAGQFDMPVKLIVIDTLSRALAGGNENAPDDMGALVMNMDRVRAETGSSVMFIHHSGKDQAKGARGHSLLRAAIDTEIEVVADGNRRVATVVKQREIETAGIFEFQLRVVELGKNHRGKPITSCVVEGLEVGHTAGAVPAPRLKGHVRRALEVLHDLLATSGKGGYDGVPAGCQSVPEEWWRKRFYERTVSDGKDDMSQNGKRMAFNRAVLELVDRRLVGVNKERIWSVRDASGPAQTHPHKAAQNDG